MSFFGRLLSKSNRWVRGFCQTPQAEKWAYVKGGFKGVARRAIDSTQFSVRKRLEKSLSRVHDQTISRHVAIVQWACRQAEVGADFGQQVRSEDLGKQHERLMKELDRRFRGALQSQSLRILIHLPPAEVALAWSSSVGNMLSCFDYLGIRAEALPWDAPVERMLTTFKPNVLLTIWHENYLKRIDWEAVAGFRQESPLLIGINAPEEELYGSKLVGQVLGWADKAGVSFFFKERPRAYLAGSYERFWDRGYEVVALEYGANPLLYYPVGGVEVDMHYSFLGSLHRDKWSRYLSYFGPILERHPGILIGPGWPTGLPRTLPAEAHKFIYARASIGLNLHHETQLKEPVEINERTYNLAAAGIPQVVDSPILIRERFSDEAFFRAESAADFQDLFESALSDPHEALRRASAAHQEVLMGQTMFHRLSEFADDLERMLGRT